MLFKEIGYIKILGEFIKTDKTIDIMTLTEQEHSNALVSVIFKLFLL